MDEDEGADEDEDEGEDAGAAASAASGGDDVGDTGFEMTAEETQTMEKDHQKVYSKDMAFANSMSADDELKEREMQRLQLEALLRIKGGGDSTDAALSGIDLSALTMSAANSAGHSPPMPKAKKVKGKGNAKGKGKGKAKAKAAIEVDPMLPMKQESAAEIAANPALMSKAQLRLQARQQLKAQMVKAQTAAQSPARKDRPNVGKIGEWGESEVAAWLATIVEEASVHQWMAVVKKEKVDGRRLLELTFNELTIFTSGYLTISKEVDVVVEGIRRLNFEGAKAGRKTLRKAIGKKLGM